MAMHEPVPRGGQVGDRRAIQSPLSNGRLDRATQYVANCAVIVIAASIVSIILAKLVDVNLPGLPSVLDGRDILDPRDHPNYLRNLLEMTSFLATTVVLGTAVGAFVFTRHQLKEARQTRLTTLYATLESRWASEEMRRSKALFAQMNFKFTDYRKATHYKGEPSRSYPEFVHHFIIALRKSEQYDYFTLMVLPEYLEYIGLLYRQGYVDLQEIGYILGVVCIQVEDTMTVHIEHLRAEAKDLVGEYALPNAPQEFECLTQLAKAFKKLYQSA